MIKKAALNSGRRVLFPYLFILFLLVAHWVTVLLTNSTQNSSTTAVLFDLDREYNIPTFTNALLLATGSIVSVALAFKAKIKIQKLGWLSFGILFGYLALDEALIIHEQLAEPTRKLLNISNSNPLYHAWVIPGIVIVFIMIFITVVIKKHFKELKVFAEILKYVAILAGGVIFLEIIGTFVYDNTLIYRLLMVPAEEIFELTMAMVILQKLLHQHMSKSHG